MAATSNFQTSKPRVPTTYQSLLVGVRRLEHLHALLRALPPDVQRRPNIRYREALAALDPPPEVLEYLAVGGVHRGVEGRHADAADATAVWGSVGRVQGYK